MTEETKPKSFIFYESFRVSVKKDFMSLLTLGASCAFAYWVEAGYILQTAILGMWVWFVVAKGKRMLDGDDSRMKHCYTREEALAAVEAVDWEGSE